MMLTGRDAAMLGARIILEAELAKAGVKLATEAGQSPEPPKLTHPIEARRQPAPAGYKKVFHGHKPHQGSKECARRRRQMGLES